jgi:hypothetical protein
MPQVDIDTLVSICSGGSDRKIACEPQQEVAAAGDQTLDDGDEEEKPDQTPPDFPPESFWLSKDAEFDWFDRNAFYERKDSGKGNRDSNSTNLNPNLTSNNVNSSSQRFSKNLKSKAKIIGLPKTQKTSYVDSTNKRRYCKKPANTRLFPKRSESVGTNSNKPMAEPSSPKVSCIGRVRSKRGRKKRSDKKKVEIVERSRAGICSRFMAIFRSRRRTVAPPLEEPPRVSVTVRERRSSVRSESEAGEPPGLGGMMKFASGRRSASSWVADD